MGANKEEGSERWYLSEFQYDKEIGVYVPPADITFTINYSDGTDIERYIFNIIKNAKDINDGSEELMQGVKDWPSYYHLGIGRSNILKILNIPHNVNVLELGSGCGAITRYLGESFQSVDAIEGSILRAQVTKERCRDLKNVQVFCSNFKHIRFNLICDVVTLVGVLEYAPVYFKNQQNPQDACLFLLKLVKNVLKEEGILIIAIENKIGLKYWSGCIEDHTGKIFDSIHDYPSDLSPVTFSKREITELLIKAGFSNIQFYYCFPDYKFAFTIFSNIGDEKEFCLYNWIEIPFSSYDSPRIHIFHEGLAIKTLAEAGLLREFANSFLIIASKSDFPIVSQPDWVAKKFSIKRQKRFQCETTLKIMPLLIEKRNTIEDKPDIITELPKVNQKLGNASWHKGDLMIFNIFKALFKENWKNEISKFLYMYYQELINRFYIGVNDDEGYQLLKGSSVDFIFRNIIIENNKWIYIDNEWNLGVNIPVDYVIYRCIIYDVIGSQEYWIKSRVKDLGELSIDFIKYIFPKYNEQRHNRNNLLEKIFQGIISGSLASCLEFKKIVSKSVSNVFRYKKTSIIIPIYNTLKYTKRCLDALYKVTAVGLFELIVVDNGSDDGTKDFLKEFKKNHPNMKLILNEKNYGFARACNQGASVAEGEYILFLNNDTVPLNGWLEEMLNIIENEKKIGIVGSKLLFPDGTIQHAGVEIRDFPYPISPYHIYYKKPSDFPEANIMKEYQVVTAACCIMRKELFESIGGFDEGFVNGYEDVDFCFQTKKLGYKIVYCPTSVLYHFESQTEGRHKFEEENIIRLNKKWKGKINPDKELESLEIIIVTFNSLNDISVCLNSILQFTSYPYRIIIVDNNSTDGTKEFLESFQKKSSSSLVKVIFNKENVGFSRACNQGIKLAVGKYIVLLNPDTAVTPEWDKRMVAHLKEKDVAAVGPISNYAYGLQNLNCYLQELSLPNGNFEITHLSEAVYNSYKGEHIETRLLIGFCLMIKREVVNKIGMFDNALFLGNDDLDFSWRVRLNGYKLLIAKDVFIYHKGQASFKTKPVQETKSLVQESTDRLAEKLIKHYGFGNVPLPEELWGIDWFRPSERYKDMFRRFDKKISIIVLNYKKSDDTIECLNSIYDSDYERFQVIVVDNNSQDGSIEKIKEWAKENGKNIVDSKLKQGFKKELILMPNDENMGFAAGNNIGIRCALKNGAEYVWLLNNDTVIEKESLFELLKSSLIDKRIGLISSKIYFYENRDMVQYDGYIPSDEGKKDIKKDSIRIVDFAPACSLLIKKEVFQDIGYLDEKYFLYFEDNDFCKRAKAAGWMILYNPNSKIYHKGGASIGKWLKTPISAYYAPRNFLYCNADHNIAECFSYLEKSYWSQLNKSPECIKGFVEGVKDFIMGKNGKVAENQLDPKTWLNWADERLKAIASELIDNPDKSSLLKFLSLAQAILSRKHNIMLSPEQKAISCCIEGECLFEKGEIDKSISFFEKAIELDPSCSQAYNNLAAIYWQKQDIEKSIYYIEKSIKLAPSDPDVLWNYKEIMHGLGLNKEAQQLDNIYKLVENKPID